MNFNVLIIITVINNVTLYIKKIVACLNKFSFDMYVKYCNNNYWSLVFNRKFASHISSKFIKYLLITDYCCFICYFEIMKHFTYTSCSYGSVVFAVPNFAMFMDNQLKEKDAMKILLLQRMLMMGTSVLLTLNLLLL